MLKWGRAFFAVAALSTLAAAEGDSLQTLRFLRLVFLFGLAVCFILGFRDEHPSPRREAL